MVAFLLYTVALYGGVMAFVRPGLNWFFWTYTGLFLLLMVLHLVKYFIRRKLSQIAEPLGVTSSAPDGALVVGPHLSNHTPQRSTPPSPTGRRGGV